MQLALLKKCYNSLFSQTESTKSTPMCDTAFITRTLSSTDRRASPIMNVSVETITWTLKPLKSLYDTVTQISTRKHISVIFFRIITVIYVFLLNEKFPFKYNGGAIKKWDTFIIQYWFWFKFHIIILSATSMNYHYLIAMITIDQQHRYTSYLIVYRILFRHVIMIWITLLMLLFLKLKMHLTFSLINMH